MEEINKYKIINKLKGVYRFNSQDKRNESSAEHSWGCLMLANFLLPQIKQKLSKERVLELLMFHDLVEIYAGDTVIHPDNNDEGKEERELAAAKRLKDELPKAFGNQYWSAFEEFEARSTPEAKFAKAVDWMESMIHELDYKKDWKDWSEEFTRTKLQHAFEPFPELQSIFEELVTHLRENNYFGR